MKKRLFLLNRSGAFQKGVFLNEALVIILVLSLIGAISLPFIARHREREQLSSCQYNLRAIGSALEMLGDDNQQEKGRILYPATLSPVFEGHNPYLKPEPLCPSNKTSYGYEVDSASTCFTIYCRGFHKRAGERIDAGYPQYSAVSGIMVR